MGTPFKALPSNEEKVLVVIGARALGARLPHEDLAHEVLGLLLPRDHSSCAPAEARR